MANSSPVASMPQSIYMGAPVRLTTLANGAQTNAGAMERLAQSAYLEPVADQPVPGITIFGGDFLNLTVIEGDDGLIVYDTGETLEDGARFLKKIRGISQKPIAAVIYSHSHYVHGTKALIGDDKGVPIVGHPNVNLNMATGGSGNLYAETAPLQISRTLQQFNHFTPKTGPNAAAGAHLTFGRSGYVPVNTPVVDGAHLTIAGVEMQFFTKYGSDTDDCLTVFLPKLGVVLNNILWPFVPNIYTLRGSKFRDPREWRDALKVIRALNADVLVCTHARAVCGRAVVAETLDQVIDGLDAILDQTLRGILRGLGPDDLRAFVKLPRHLAEAPNLAEVYGEISHFGPYLYNQALGWFDGDAGSINPLPPDVQAERLVEAMGGSVKVLALAQAAFAGREFAWSVQLVNYLYRLDHRDTAVRSLKADILEQMGRIAPAHTIRSWYLSQAMALRGDVTIPRLQFSNPRILANSEPAETMDQYRVRIDPEKSTDMDIVVALEISDRDRRHGWHLRRGVVEFVRDLGSHRREADLEMATTFENWLRFFVCKISAADFIEGVHVSRGSVPAITKFFSAFDFYAASENSIV